MRLKTVSFMFLMYLMSEATSKNYQQDYSFPPYLHTPLSHPSDSSLYLPPETHTSNPYFPSQTTNDLQYQYLPLTGTKAPTIYPSPFPMISSSLSYEPFRNEDDENNVNKKRQFRSTRSPPKMQPYLNRTQYPPIAEMVIEKTETHRLPKMVAYDHSIDQIVPKTFNPTQTPFNVPMADRRTTKSTEGIRNELVNGDQKKTESQHEIRYLLPQADFVSTTTETAIPILRLSNEMDLDGSYSYEVLGADQTHYVQHSRMENVGTDNEEQVVEGSYSYIGDDGRTYTVHYIADANGFRASGDHLPVPPPIPEIIQRSIQYNLAEEANNPSQIKTWDQEENYSNVFDNMNILAAASNNRNLFTGRKPEAFSRNFLKQVNHRDLAIQPTPYTQITIESQHEFNKEKTQHSKGNEQIAPQITFLASQGAHVPIVSSPQPVLPRMHTDVEKEISQLVKYEKENNDNTPQESINKQLWRWQYGMTTNPEKTSISRSSSENSDNIIINFNDMTPEQYSNMLHSQFQSDEKHSSQNKLNENREIKTFNKIPYPQINEDRTIIATTRNNFENTKKHTENKDTELNFPYSSDWFSEQYTKLKMQDSSSTTNEKTNITKKHNLQKKTDKNLIIPYNLLPQTQTATQSHHYGKSQNKNNLKFYERSDDNSSDSIKQEQTHHRNYNVNHKDASKHVTNVTFETTAKRDEFKSNSDSIMTTQNTLNVLKNNIFLKKILTENNTKFGKVNKSSSVQLQSSIQLTTKTTPKMINFPYNYNDVKVTRRKPQNSADILNFLSLKNTFESNKIKQKKQNYELPNSNIDTKYDNTYITNGYEPKAEEDNYSYLTDEQNERLRGIVKIYKTLQRNNNVEVARNDNGMELRKDTSAGFEPIQTHKLPPLGRAGPSVRTYSPPVYV